MLKIVNLTKRFGGLKALENVNIEVKKGEILGVIGPNGAGKTTLFSIISGFLKPTSGKIIFEGKEIQGLPPARIVKMGIARTFQIVKPLKNLTVFENILTASGYQNYYGISFMKKWDEEKHKKKADEIIELVGLSRYRDSISGSLPLGLQKRIEIAKALALNPKLLLLDEPTAGMSYEESNEIKELIKDVKNRGVTIMLVEHNVPFAVELSNRMYVLSYGKIIAHGTPEEVVKNKKVIEAYLGGEYAIA
jgi:branched-chain amino acid transport system ATP-binding protein